MSRQIVEHEQEAKGRWSRRQRQFCLEPLLPFFPAGFLPRNRFCHLCLRQARKNLGQTLFQPRMEHAIGATRDPFRYDPPGRRVEKREQFRCSAADILVRVALRRERRAPMRPRNRSRRKRSAFVLAPDLESELFSGRVSKLD